jgi:Ca-activated chloride channel family protein
LPLRLGILIDTSNSQRNNDLYNASVAGIKDFVNQAMRQEGDRVFFELFSTTAEATALLSKQQLSGVSFPLKVGGATALYDAIALACTDKMGKSDWRAPTRRVIVLVSDGDDNQSHITRSKAEAFPVSSGVVVFAISTNNTGRELKGDAVLEKFAKVSGGSAYSGLRQRDIPKVLNQIREQLESMYYLTYTPPVAPREGDVHKVEVQPVKGLKAEFRMPKYYVWNP